MSRTTAAPVPTIEWLPIEIRSDTLAPTPTAEHSPIRTSPPVKTPGAMLANGLMLQSWSIELPVFKMQNSPTRDPGPTWEPARIAVPFPISVDVAITAEGCRTTGNSKLGHFFVKSL